jgi:hypothetical protein
VLPPAARARPPPPPLLRLRFIPSPRLLLLCSREARRAPACSSAYSPWSDKRRLAVDRAKGSARVFLLLLRTDIVFMRDVRLCSSSVRTSSTTTSDSSSTMLFSNRQMARSCMCESTSVGVGVSGEREWRVKIGERRSVDGVVVGTKGKEIDFKERLCVAVKHACTSARVPPPPPHLPLSHTHAPEACFGGWPCETLQTFPRGHSSCEALGTAA